MMMPTKTQHMHVISYSISLFPAFQRRIHHQRNPPVEGSGERTGKPDTSQ